MKVLGRIFLNSRKEGRKDGKTERQSFLIMKSCTEEPISRLLKINIHSLDSD